MRVVIGFGLGVARKVISDLRDKGLNAVLAYEAGFDREAN